MIWRKYFDGLPCFDSFRIVTIDPAGPEVIGFTEGPDLSAGEFASVIPEAVARAAATRGTDGSTDESKKTKLEAKLFVFNTHLHRFFADEKNDATLAWVFGDHLSEETPSISELIIVHSQNAKVIMRGSSVPK